MPHYFHADDLAPSLARAVVAVGKKPKQFFEEMDVSDNLWDSVILMSMLMVFPATELIYFSEISYLHIVFPAVIAFGLIIGWLWSEYVCWALRVFLRKRVSKRSVFQVVTYASAPNILHLTLFLSPVALLWQTYLMWRGFVSHLGLNSEVATWVLIMPGIFVSFSGMGILMFMGVTGIIEFE